MMSVSENFLVELLWLFIIQNKACSFPRQGICIYVGNSFYDNVLQNVLTTMSTMTCTHFGKTWVTTKIGLL